MDEKTFQGSHFLTLSMIPVAKSGLNLLDDLSPDKKKGMKK